MRTNLVTICSSLALCISSFAHAEHRTESARYALNPIDQVSVGARIGNQSVDAVGGSTLSYGAFADYGIAHNVLVGGAFDYWSNSSGSLTNNSITLSDFTTSANAKLLITGLTSTFRPFVLGGLAYHNFTVSTARGSSVLQDRKLEAVRGRVGFDIGAGAMYRIQTAVDLIGEVRLRRMAQRDVNLDQVAISGALAYNL